MALVLKDRVRETSTTTGTGTFTLAGAVAGFQSFSAIGTGNSTYYTIVMSTDWEVGIGTWTSPNQLSRDTVLASTNAGAAVNFGSGTKDIFLTYPAEVAIAGSGTTNYVPKFTGTSAIGNSVIYDDGTKVGIGTTAISATLHVSTSSTDAISRQEIFRLSRTGGVSGAGYLVGRSALLSFSDSSNFTLTAGIGGIRNNAGSDYNGSLAFYISNTGSVNAFTVSDLTEAMRINSIGLGIGTTAPAAKLDVSGTTRFGSTGADTITLRGQVSANSSVGTSGQVLTSQGANLPPQWTTPSGSGTVTQVNTTGSVSGITLTGGPINTTGTVTLGGSLDLSAPPAIGGTTPNAITGTTITANTEIDLPAVVNTGSTIGRLHMVDGGDGYDYLNIDTWDGSVSNPVYFPGGVNITGGVAASQFTGDYAVYTGNGTSYSGYIQLRGYSNANAIMIQAPASPSVYTLTLPTTAGSANQVLSTNGTGVLSWTDKFVLGAGTATAGTAPLKFTSGTNLTTAEAGAMEYNGTSVFITGTTASGRGINFAPQMVRINTDRAKTTNNTTLEAVFDAANDTLALAANTLYYFKGVYVITKSASGTAAGVTIGFAFSNAQQDIGYKSIGFTVATGTAQTTIYNTVATAITATATATGATDYVIELEGWFKSNATTGGTLIPQFAQSVVGTTVAPTAKANTWFMIQPMSSTPTATLIAGNWS